MAKFYTAVGSRQTPPHICDALTHFTRLAETMGWVMRSGGAPGADVAAENGVTSPGNKEIYLPWGAFNNNKSLLCIQSVQAKDFVERLLGDAHWDNLSEGAKKLHARNVHQVLGQHMNAPSKFLICWTEGGKIKGGTATAIKIAMMYHIPVFNLGDPKFSAEDEVRLMKILEG